MAHCIQPGDVEDGRFIDDTTADFGEWDNLDVGGSDECCQVCGAINKDYTAFIFSVAVSHCGCWKPKDGVQVATKVPNDGDLQWISHPISGVCGDTSSGTEDGLFSLIGGVFDAVVSAEEHSESDASPGTSEVAVEPEMLAMTVQNAESAPTKNGTETAATCSPTGGINCCPEFTTGDNDGKGGEHFVQKEDYVEEKGCKGTCLDLYPDARGITESLTQRYARTKHNKCWCEMGDPILKKHAGYQTCIFK